MDVRVRPYRSWALKNWCFWTVVMEKTLESPLGWEEIKPVHPRENQSWIFIGRTDAAAETLILWPPNGRNYLTGKDPDTGKDWRREEKGTTEDEMVGWCHRVDGHEFEQDLGVGDGQGSLVCCSPWGCRVRYDWVTELKPDKTIMVLTDVKQTIKLYYKNFLQSIWNRMSRKYKLPNIVQQP